MRRIDTEQRGGTQVAGRVGLALFDLLGRDENLRHGNPRGAQPRDGERTRRRR